MLRLGANEYVTKNSNGTQMVEAIMQVLAGNIFVCDEIKNILSDTIFRDDKDKADINLLSGKNS
jgi:two-component system invasion response regulator UvrY